MTRLPDPQDPLFARLNASIGFDQRLWPEDIAGSRAHVPALTRAGTLTAEEATQLEGALDAVAGELEAGAFGFEDTDEDIHMAIERRVTELAGPVGGKLHTARSRNDQVATDVAMFTRAAAETTASGIQALCRVLVDAAERHLDWPLPGYTHL